MWDYPLLWCPNLNLKSKWETLLKHCCYSNKSITRYSLWDVISHTYAVALCVTVKAQWTARFGIAPERTLRIHTLLVLSAVVALLHTLIDIWNELIHETLKSDDTISNKWAQIQCRAAEIAASMPGLTTGWHCGQTTDYMVQFIRDKAFSVQFNLDWKNWTMLHLSGKKHKWSSQNSLLCYFSLMSCNVRQYFIY